MSLGVLDIDVTGCQIGFSLHQVALYFVQTGQFDVTGAVAFIDQTPLFGGKVTVFLIDAGQFDTLDVVRISGTHLFDHREPRFCNVEIGNGDICLIFTQFVEAGKSVEKHPVCSQTVGEAGGILVVTVGAGIVGAGIIGCTGAEIVGEIGTDRGRISTVPGIEGVLGDLQLFPIGFEVGTVGKSLIEVTVDRGQIDVFILVIGGEFDIGGQYAFGITHQHRQGIDGGIVLIFGGNEVAVSGIHLDLKVQHIAQRNCTCLIFQTGIAQQGLLIDPVFTGNADVFHCQQNFVVGAGNGVHQRAAGVCFDVRLVIDGTVLDHHIEFAGETVKEQPCGMQSGIGAERIGPAGIVAVRFAAAHPTLSAGERKFSGNDG